MICRPPLAVWLSPSLSPLSSPLPSPLLLLPSASATRAVAVRGACRPRAAGGKRAERAGSASRSPTKLPVCRPGPFSLFFRNPASCLSFIHAALPFSTNRYCVFALLIYDKRLEILSPPLFGLILHRSFGFQPNLKHGSRARCNIIHPSWWPERHIRNMVTEGRQHCRASQMCRQILSPEALRFSEPLARQCFSVLTLLS